MVTTKQGDVIVTQCHKHQVTIFGADGKKPRTLGSTAGSSKMQFKYPCGVAVDGLGHIYVADTGNHRIQKFTMEGKHIAMAGQKGNGEREFIDPKDMVFNTVSNRLYVADSRRVQVLQSNLTFTEQIGVQQLENAFGIACDRAGDIYVSDNKKKNIRKFGFDGRLLNTFAFMHSSVPVTVAVDQCGYIYTSDEPTHKIFVLDSTGTCVSSFGREGEATGAFRKPRVITVDNEGKVYVCDNLNNRVQVF